MTINAVFCQYAVKQHFFFYVLFHGAVGHQGDDAAIVGHGMEIEVLRHGHHIALARAHEA